MMNQLKTLVVGVAMLSVFVFCSNGYSQGLIGHWTFDEGSGTVAADSSGNSNDGTIFNENNGLGDGGSVWVTDPDRGTVISFDGTAEGAYVMTANAIPVMTLEQNFTWMFWGKQGEGNGSNHILMGNRFNPEGVDFVPRQFIKFTPTKFEWHMNGNGDDNMDYDDLVVGEWNHHVVVKSGALLTYYRNGLIMAQQEITQALIEPQPLFFGGCNVGDEGENWNGYLDDARIYDVALSRQEVIDVFVSEGGVKSYAGDESLQLK